MATPEDCRQCGGRGGVWRKVRDLGGHASSGILDESYVSCEICHGRGRITPEERARRHAQNDSWGKPTADQGPRFKHDCSECEFLGTSDGHDLYVCLSDKTAKFASLIARYGE